ncbi:hypothetical protein G5V59_00770 [Nocardioides sp. W3-2-3]|uniref:hypothetical protein n=1 Tax=Nocardioides convexus TaxID=2712224 RepID=UPI0024189CCC|nr:hypothetical protein [Nocardioides convexus]NGZ99465.1 hypothetical protein [Nocardioides convexus]
MAPPPRRRRRGHGRADDGRAVDRPGAGGGAQRMSARRPRRERTGRRSAEAPDVFESEEDFTLESQEPALHVGLRRRRTAVGERGRPRAGRRGVVAASARSARSPGQRPARVG